MNKLATIAIAALMAFVGYCGYRASLLTPEQIQQQIESSPRYSPNFMHRVQRPPPGISPEAVREEAALYFAAAEVAKLDETMKIHGQPIVVGLPLAEIDKKTISHARSRKLYNVHE